MAELPIYDAVRLGICNQQLKQNTDPMVWTQARCQKTDDDIKGTSYVSIHNEERWNFLLELEPKLPGHELCHYCRIFHPRIPLPLSRPSPQPPTSGCDVKEVQFRRWGIDWGFAFRDCYAATSRDAFRGNPTNPHGIALSEFCISTDWAFTAAYRNLYNASRSPFKRFVSYTKLDSEAKIHNQHLIVHRIQRLWIPICLQGTDVLIRYGAGDIAGDYMICSHHSLQTGVMIQNLTLPLREGLRYVLAARSVLDSIDAGDMPLPRIIKRCEDCPTEYCITFHVHNDNSIEIVLDVWQNFGWCRSPQTPGWSTCWGPLNPRFSAAALDESWRKSWLESDVGYVADETLFAMEAGQSAAKHHSAAAVLQRFRQLQQSNSDTPGELRHARSAPLALVPQMSRQDFKKLRTSVLHARYDAGGPRLALPPFPFEFRTSQGLTKNVSYTRSPWHMPPQGLVRDQEQR
ncbi:hypothetical protein BJ170DRAFT_593704 [Xylariales sp. AK1849]|nr:hypothetical protein BJ170DRAFT_593704 [Xylariales sp. AK1849]